MLGIVYTFNMLYNLMYDGGVYIHHLCKCTIYKNKTLYLETDLKYGCKK